MDQAGGFEVPPGSEGKLVYKLNKSLYGLKQSGRNWNHVLHCFLQENDFVESPVDNCVYTKQVGSGLVAMLVWVDDIIIAASDMVLLSKTKEMLNKRFHMKDLGRLSYFLGIHFEQGDGFVKMDQKRYISKVLERFEMSDGKPKPTPSEQKFEFGSENPVDPKRYREAVGSLVYAMTCTRPDICWVVTKLSQKCDNGLTLIGYSDADWASSTDDRRSISGYCFSLNKAGPLISWKSRKQPTVALSSCEAEYIALAAAVQEGMYLIQIVNDVGEVNDPVLIFEDNQGTIALSMNPVNRQRSKHIDVRYHFIRNVQNAGKVIIKYCPTADMVADVMTKPLENSIGVGNGVAVVVFLEEVDQIQTGYEVTRFGKRSVGMRPGMRFSSKAPELAVQELTRCVKELGFPGVEVGSHINEWNLDAPELQPVFAAAEELDCAIFVHPWDMELTGRMSKYWLPWLVGMPGETAQAICCMIFGGVLERYPKLKVCFAHGGGAFPFTIGRIEHGFNVRPDLCAVENPVNPRKYIGQIFTDCLVHDEKALKYLVDTISEVLVDVIRRYHRHHHLLDMLTVVNKEVADIANDYPDVGLSFQVPAPTHTLRAQVFL
ncbi:hypothetical protein ACROYT_G024633 [Oculina patagonica]